MKFSTGVFSLAAIAAFCWWQSDRLAAVPAMASSSDTSAPERVIPQPDYKCEGKTRCHEMTTCEEAVFYLQHCPGVKMDGDKDGDPCEDWCGE